MSMAFDIDWPGFNVKTFSLCSSCITGNGWCLVCLGQGKEPKWMNLHMWAFICGTGMTCLMFGQQANGTNGATWFCMLNLSRSSVVGGVLIGGVLFFSLFF
jgi:hypothetical protein